MGSMKTLITIALFLSVCWMAASCDVSDDETSRVLRAHGFTDVKTHGHAFFACSKGDTFATEFSAKNAQGQPVSGAVCCGLLKSCTVRF